MAVSVCGGLEGIIQVGSEGYTIQPAHTNRLIEGEHLVSKLQSHQHYVQTNKDDVLQREKRDALSGTREPLTGDEDMFTWYEVRYESTTHHRQVDLDESMAAADPLTELEETGHAVDKVWQVGHRNMWVRWRYIGS